MPLKNITLEMSLKPFKQTDDVYIEAVCREAITQWLPLIRDTTEMVSVLLWTADGSEILTYQGDLDTPIEWARYIGAANPKWTVPGDPEKKAIHSRPYLYVENPPTITYRDLARIVATLKRVGREVTGLPIRVGETFDPGTEFAKSRFKYELHNEICLADTGGPKSFVCCYATLNADRERYIGFPEGIPQDTPFGTFLGRQCQHMLRDIGFDYLWLSNGFGFGLETWMTRGPMFDGRTFDASQAKAIREKILNFWRCFRRECPDIRIETRGTNLSTGIDLASDAVPLGDLYDGGFNFQPPPNSPWAALNGDFGLELAGFMSHIAKLPPGGGYPFRYYTHDPWWKNSPWLDRYGREPHDIYMPMSVSRIDEHGTIENPNAILFLTIDDSFGEMPRQVPSEVTPHIQAGLREKPDAPGPLVWVYPFDEFHAMTFGETPRTDEAFFADWFMRSAIKRGLPVNTVVSTGNFLTTLARTPALYRESVLVTSVPDGDTTLSRTLCAHVRQGGRVLLYGPVRHADDELLSMMSLRKAGPVSGSMAIDLKQNADAIVRRAYPTTFEHRSIMNAGGMDAVLSDAGADVIAMASSGPDQRVAASVRSDPSWTGGAIGYVRGSCASSYLGGDLISGIGHLPTEDDPSKHFFSEVLMRHALAVLGHEISACKNDAAQPDPITTIHRHDNAFFFSGYVPDMTVELRLRLAQGAPLLLGYDAEIKDGRACYRLPRAWHRECRVFIEQAEDGVVSCHEKTPEQMGIRRRLRITGLRHATVRLFDESGERDVSMVVNGSYPYFEGPFVRTERRVDVLGRYRVANDVSGELIIGW